MTYELKTFCDSFNSGNYDENKHETITKEITEAEKSKYINYLLFIGAKHYETSKAHFYELETNARQYKQYIFYK